MQRPRGPPEVLVCPQNTLPKHGITENPGQDANIVLQCPRFSRVIHPTITMTVCQGKLGHGPLLGWACMCGDTVFLHTQPTVEGSAHTLPHGAAYGVGQVVLPVVLKSAGCTGREACAHLVRRVDIHRERCRLGATGIFN